MHPLDSALGIAGRAGVRLTGAALRAVAEEVSEKSFAKAAESVGRLCGVAVTAKQAGREIAAWDRSAPALAEAPADRENAAKQEAQAARDRADAEEQAFRRQIAELEERLRRRDGP